MSTKANKPTTGTGSFSGDLLVLALMIVSGVFITVWFLSLETVRRESILHGFANLITLILMQPGVFLSVALANKATDAAQNNKPWKRLAILAITTFICVGILIPMALSPWVNSFF